MIPNIFHLIADSFDLLAKVRDVFLNLFCRVGDLHRQRLVPLVDAFRHIHCLQDISIVFGKLFANALDKFVDT